MNSIQEYKNLHSLLGATIEGESWYVCLCICANYQHVHYVSTEPVQWLDRSLLLTMMPWVCRYYWMERKKSLKDILQVSKNISDWNNFVLIISIYCTIHWSFTQVSCSQASGTSRKKREEWKFTAFREWGMNWSKRYWVRRNKCKRGMNEHLFHFVQLTW